MKAALEHPFVRKVLSILIIGIATLILMAVASEWIESLKMGKFMLSLLAFGLLFVSWRLSL